MTRLPTIGLSRPPAEPGGGVISVNTASDSPLKPFQNSTARISTSQDRPNAVARIGERHGDAVAAAAAA